jgi:hypothetical protein
MNSELNEPGPSVEKSMLEAILDGDGKSYRNYLSAIPGDRAFQILGVATSAAVFRKWPDDPSLQAVVAYVDEVEKRYPEELPVARSVIESVVRGIFGETDLLDGTPGEEILVAEVLLIKSIGFDVLVSTEHRNAYFNEVLAAVG